MRAQRLIATATALAAGTYAGYAAVAWLRYGHPSRGRPDEHDDLLDAFMPMYDVVERHHIQVRAPAPVTFAIAKAMDLWESPAVRTIFKARELVFGSKPDVKSRPRGLVDQAGALGWGVLGEVADREIVFGAVTRPWEANVTFQAVAPGDFAAFDEPGLVKIVWNLRSDPIDPTSSIFRTETRAIATDAEARRRFRRYWTAFSPGIIVIRWAMLRPLKKAAERGAHRVAPNGALTA